MKTFADYIDKFMLSLPDLCTDDDLIAIGLYKCQQTAYAARRKGTSPPFLKIPNGRILYPREGIIEYLKKCKGNNDN